MKYIIAAMVLGLNFLISAIAIITGLYQMLSGIYNHTSLIQGFELFSLGTILSIVTASGYIITQLLHIARTNSLALAELINIGIRADMKKPGNPFDSLFDKMGSGSIQMGKIEEDGSITPLGENEIKGDEFFKSTLNSLFGNKFKQDEKKFEEMTIPELEVREKELVDNQQFKEAATIRDRIIELKKGSE